MFVFLFTNATICCFDHTWKVHVNLYNIDVRESSDNVSTVGNAVTVNYNGEVQMSVFINLNVTDQIKLYRPNQEFILLLTVFSLKKYIRYRQKYLKSKLVYRNVRNYKIDRGTGFSTTCCFRMILHSWANRITE